MAFRGPHRRSETAQRPERRSRGRDGRRESSGGNREVLDAVKKLTGELERLRKDVDELKRKSLDSASDDGDANAAVLQKVSKVLLTRLKDYFTYMDRNKDGKLDPAEWNVSQRIKPAFEKANVDLSKPMSEKEFYVAYVKVFGAEGTKDDQAVARRLNAEKKNSEPADANREVLDALKKLTGELAELRKVVEESKPQSRDSAAERERGPGRGPGRGRGGRRGFGGPGGFPGRPPGR